MEFRRVLFRSVWNGERSLRQRGDARAVGMRRDQLFHSTADVVAWDQVGGADEVIRQRAVEQNLGLALDERLELRLPLLGSAITGRGQQRQQFFRTSGAAQDLVEATVSGDAIATFTGQDERAARLEDARAGAHPFDGLIQVLIERVAAVGRSEERRVGKEWRSRWSPY